MSRTALATIHLGALRRNLARVRERARGARVMAIVKADGYGHGLERVARACADADALGVAAMGDGQRLRAAGHRQRIVVLSGPDELSDLAEFRRLQLDAVIHHESQLAWLETDSRVAPGSARPIRVWLKIDTGMHRLGFAPARAAEVHARLRRLVNVDADISMMTHFAASEEFDNPLTAAQIESFDAATSSLAGARSLANSAGLLGWSRDLAAVANRESSTSWVRAGGLLYGLSVVAGSSAADLGFEGAMSLTTKLISIAHLRKGDRIGYGGTFACPQDMTVGVAAIGYGDGYPRSAATGTPVLLGGMRAQIVGRVSMDLVTIDLSGIVAPAVGDRVLLWGSDLAVETVAAHAGTISYDLTCGMTRRVLVVEDEN